MQAHLVLLLLLGDQGPTGQCPRAGTQVMGVDTTRGHPLGKCAELGSIQDSPSTRTHGKRKTQPGAGSRELSVSVPDVSLTRTADLSTDMSPGHPHRHSIAATPPLRQSLELVYLLVRVPKPQPPGCELPHVRPWAGSPPPLQCQTEPLLTGGEQRVGKGLRRRVDSALRTFGNCGGDKGGRDDHT